MPYQYVENRYPTSDPNTDLNFNNDILYENLVRDQARIDEATPRNANVIPSRSREKRVSKIEKTKDYSNMIYVLFIFVVILVIVLWYVYNNSDKQIKNDPIDAYASDADLSMLSPDFGNGERYGLKND